MSHVLLEYWSKALTLDIGLCIETDDRVLLRQQLYKARVEAGDIELEQLIISFPINENELWIVRKDADERPVNSYTGA